MYIVVSVGNTDNKLKQQEWHQFTWDIDFELRQAGKVHFFGGPPNWMSWQNVAWIIEIQPKDVDGLGAKITSVREKYNQDSAFVMIGEGLFL